MSNPQVQWTQAQRFYEAGRYQDCQSVCAPLLAEIGAIPDVIHLDALCDYRLGRTQQALDKLLPLALSQKENSGIQNTVGCVCLDLGLWAQAEEALFNAYRLTPQSAEIAYNLGLLYQKTGRHKKAYRYYSDAVKLQPQDSKKRLNLAQTLLNLERFGEAESLLKEGLSLAPGNESITRLLGLLYAQTQREEQAKPLFEHLVSQFPERAEYHGFLANVFVTQNQVDSAINCYHKAIDLDPNQAVFYSNLGAAYEAAERYDEAKQQFLLALSINPNLASAHSNLGRLYYLELNDELAEKHSRIATELDPKDLTGWQNYGNVWQRRGDQAKAQACYARALECNPKNYITLYNLANSYIETGDFDLAISRFSDALKVNPGYPDAIFNLGVTQLLVGDYANGWRNYFLRPRFMPTKYQGLSTIFPGMDVRGKHLFLLQAQGLGDELFFLRFLPQLKQRGAQISYLSVGKLVSLLSRCEYIDNLISEEIQVDADYMFAIDDMPLLVDMNNVLQIPPTLRFSPTLDAKGRINNLLSPNSSRPLVGITWAAGKLDNLRKFSNVRVLKKNVELQHIIDVLGNIECTVCVLQRNPSSEELANLKNALGDRILDLSYLNDDLEAMLAFLERVDIYFGVSNTNMHLMAALGRTAHVLVPHPPDWRWMHTGDESPWFPGFSVYRQDKSGDWNTALKKLRNNILQEYDVIVRNSSLSYG